MSIFILKCFRLLHHHQSRIYWSLGLLYEAYACKLVLISWYRLCFVIMFSVDHYLANHIILLMYYLYRFSLSKLMFLLSFYVMFFIITLSFSFSFYFYDIRFDFYLFSFFVSSFHLTNLNHFNVFHIAICLRVLLIIANRLLVCLFMYKIYC